MADLSLDFQFKSPINKVWKALTNSDTLAQWVMENNFKPIVGHKCQFWNKEIDLVVDCEVLVVDEPSTLSYTWVGGPIDTIVTWTLTEDGETTHLHLDHTGFEAKGQAYNGAKYGWAYKVEELQKVLGEKSSYDKGNHNIATFTSFLQGIDHEAHRERTEQIFNWITEKYPKLETEIKWNQPMFTDHGTFIIGFSVSKKHLAIAPEHVAIQHVEADIQQAGYDYTKEIIRIPWNREVDYELLAKIIDFNIWDKANCTTFWRK